MAKRPSSASKPAGLKHKTQIAPVQALPSREEILAFIGRERKAAMEAGSPHPDKVGKREIAKAFNIKGAARI